MASSVKYLEYILDILWETEENIYRKMMDEYVRYSQGVVFGRVYDDRFPVRTTSVG